MLRLIAYPRVSPMLKSAKTTKIALLTVLDCDISER